MLVVHIELKRSAPNGPTYKPHREHLDKLSGAGLETIRSKCETDGWVINSWHVAEQLPCDEGYAAATSGEGSDANPYAESFWKHDEWLIGWKSHEEAGCEAAIPAEEKS